MDQLDAMRCFLAVVDEGGFAAAARSLGRSRSAVHRAVVELEQHLATSLFARSTRRVTVTATGRAFEARCRDILTSLADAEDEVRAQQASARGVLRINAPMSFGARYLGEYLGRLSGAHPELEVVLALDDRLVHPLEDGFDVTVRIGALPEDAALIVKDVCELDSVCCASPAWLDRCGHPAAPADLRELDCLGYGHGAGRVEWRFEDEAESATRVVVRSRFSSNNGDALCNAARGGAGIAVLPRFIVADALADGSLVPVLTGFRPASLTLSLLYPASRHLSTRVRLFTEGFIDAFGTQPPWAASS